MKRHLILTITFIGVVLLLLLAFIFMNRNGCKLSKPVENISQFDPRASHQTNCVPKEAKVYMRTQSSTLDPARIITATDNEIAMMAFGQLVELDEYENIRPFLAKSWSVSPDGLEYKFELRSDVVFSNGTPFTSNNVIYTFHRLFSPKVNSHVAQYTFGNSIKGVDEYTKGLSETISGVKAIDKYTVLFSLKARQANFLTVLSYGSSSILPEGTSYELLNPTEILSAGPYYVTSYSPNEVVLAVNENITDSHRFSKIVLKNIEGGPCVALGTNEFDVVDAGPYDGEICRNENYRVVSYPGANIWFIAFGKNIPDNLRKIIYHCVELKNYHSSLSSNAVPLYDLFPAAEEKADSIQKWDHDKCILRNKTRLVLNLSKRHTMDKQLLKIFDGIENLSVTANTISDLQHRELRASGQYDLLYTEFIGTFSDLVDFASLFYSKGSVVTSGYNNPRYDNLLEQLRGAVDNISKTKIASEIESELLRNPSAIFLKQHKNIKWFKKGVQVTREGWFYGYFFHSTEGDYCN